MITRTTSSDTRWFLRGTSINIGAIFFIFNTFIFCSSVFAYFNSQYFIFNLLYSVVSFSVPQGQNVTAEADKNLEHLEYALHEIIKYTIKPNTNAHLNKVINYAMITIQYLAFFPYENKHKLMHKQK